MGATIHVLYFNGLGTGQTRKRERRTIRYLATHNIRVRHMPVDWCSKESFKVLLDRATTLTQQELKEHGRLILVGSSAGGSLAVNILGRLHDKNLSAITLCSRLHEAPLKWWDRRSLTRMAYIGVAGRVSQSFFDSVTYCGDTTIPKLTEADKRRLIIVQQWADFVVPRSTMSIAGARIYRVPGLGHGTGIMLGALRLPTIIRDCEWSGGSISG